MKFTVINQGFQCGNCGAEVPKHPTSCRNHCNQCLYSMHLDKESPGDRAANCSGLMAPLGVRYSGKKGWMILHECTECGKSIYNSQAEDDNMDLITELSTRPQS